MYNERLMAHFNNPTNMGKMRRPTVIGEATSTHCSDSTRVYLKIKKGIIIDAKFETLGCAVAIASGDAATELIKGKTIEEAARLTADDISKELGIVPDAKFHCTELAEQAILNAIRKVD